MDGVQKFVELYQEFVELLGPLQITWAMIFAALGYLLKTIIDSYFQKKKIVTDAQFKNQIEQIKEKESERISILSQISFAEESIARIFDQLLGHGKNRAADRVDHSQKPESWDRDKFIYNVTVIVLHLGILLAQLHAFRTYQYSQFQKQLKNGDISEFIARLEAVLSHQEIFREYQAELSRYALKTTQSDLSKIISTQGQLEAQPLFLKTAISWADELLNDFVESWIRYIDSVKLNDNLTLMQRGIYLREFMVQSSSKPPFDKTDLDESQLRVSAKSAEFVSALINLHQVIKSIYTQLDKLEL